jgi:hypothetical protein
MSMPPIPPGLGAESTIRRDAAGRWFHEGEPVENEAVARAFDRWVDRAEDGRYVLRNEVSWAYVEIEGAPVTVLDAAPSAEGLSLALSDGRVEALDPSTFVVDPAGRLYCRVRGGRLVAAFGRAATLRLMPLVEEDAGGLHLAVAGRALRPAPVDDPLA